MYRLIILIIVLIFIMSACNTAVTPEPTATAFMTDTASAEEMTQGAGLRLTLPPSFTPTFTPSISPTPLPTDTPTATATPTFVPVDMLCEEFLVDQTVPPDVTSIQMDDLEDNLIVDIPYLWGIVSIDIYNADTGELVQDGTVTGYFPVYLNFSPDNFPEVGNYEWIITLEMDGRPGLCEHTGTFDTREDELPGYVPPTEITPEITAEATPESTADITPELIPEMTGEATAEATVEMTAEVTAEAIAETATVAVIFSSPNIGATQAPALFPPR